MRPRLLIAFQVAAVALTVALVVGSFAAVWGAKGERVFHWGSALGPLCLLVGAFDLVALVWTVTWERNKAVAEFGSREGGKAC